MMQVSFSKLALAALCLSGAGLYGQGGYWPLAKSKRWELRSPAVGQPMVFDVEEETRGEFRVRWENPWVAATFFFRVSGDQVLLSRLDMGAGTASMPANTVYFDFARGKGSNWRSAAGEMTVLETGALVKTPSGNYQNCITIRAKGSDGGATFWTFAPGVGPVRFGQGRNAFFLTSLDHSSAESAVSTSRSNSNTRPSRPAGTTRTTETTGVLIGVDANPSARRGFDARAIRDAFDTAVDAGMNFTKIHPKWDEIEKSPGNYQFGDFERHSQRAANGKVPIYLGIRTIDTQKRSMPSAYARWRWDDARMKDRLTRLLEAVHARFQGDIRWVAIGNEVDQYFKHHQNEVDQYAKLMAAIAPVIRRLWPNAQVTVNFTWEAADRVRDYQPIFDQMDVVSFTYYPLNPDFTVKNVSEIDGHFRKLSEAAGRKRIILQELGYPSGAANKSSEEKQAQFIERSIRAARALGNQMIAMNFLWMSDLPDSVVEEFAKYYNLPNADRFKSYLATMGMFDTQGRPKQAWSVFQKEAR